MLGKGPHGTEEQLQFLLDAPEAAGSLSVSARRQFEALLSELGYREQKSVMFRAPGRRNSALQAKVSHPYATSLVPAGLAAAATTAAENFRTPSDHAMPQSMAAVVNLPLTVRALVQS